MPSSGDGLDALSVGTVAGFVEDHAPESSTLEFKETLVLDNTQTRRDTMRDVSAFANSSGGWIVVGISEEGMPHRAAMWAHLSTADAERIRQQVIDLCASHIDPAIPGLDVQTELVPETSFVVISIPAPGQIPHAVIGFDGKTEYYVRVNDTKKQMTPSELQAAFARASSRKVTPEPKDDSSNGRSAVEEALKKAQGQAGDAPFFSIAGAPVNLHADALDLQSQTVRKILAENADGHTVETTLGCVISKAKPGYRGIAASVGPYAFSLRDDGLMIWGVVIGGGTHFLQSWRDDHEKVFNQYAIVGYPLSFVRSFCALRGIMKGTVGPYAIQMAYSWCQNIMLYPGHIGLERHSAEPLPEDLDKGHTVERLIKSPYDPSEFSWLLPADQIAHDLIKHFYQAFGYSQERIPFWDEKTRVFDLDSR